MPTAPHSSSGRRPTRSISAMASTVAPMLMAPLTRLMASESPAAQPSRIEATAKPVPAEPEWKVAWMPGTAPLMTALSKPKRKPPSAALAATKVA